jgi:hypothetical protein
MIPGTCWGSCTPNPQIRPPASAINADQYGAWKKNNRFKKNHIKTNISFSYHVVLFVKDEEVKIFRE